MTESDKITTLARRYCIDNHKYWSKKYSRERTGDDLPSYSYSDADYDLFPRYQALDAILKGIEVIVGIIFPAIEECKNQLKDIAANSQTVFTMGKLNKISANAIQDERQKFIHYIGGLTVNDYDIIEPLPYRRRLLEKEASEIRKELLVNWNFDGSYWEPLMSCSPKPFIFFDKDNLETEDFEKIKRAITEHVGKIYEITEERYDYEIDSSEFDANCYETVFTDKSLNWIVYGSHEGTIAFGGDWLLMKLTNILDDKKGFINKW